MRDCQFWAARVNAAKAAGLALKAALGLSTILKVPKLLWLTPAAVRLLSEIVGIVAMLEE
jgi:hypothetical protein